MSVTVMGQKLAMPVYCSPTALQRLFHHQGERAVAAAAAKYGTMFGVSSLGTVSLEELRRISDSAAGLSVLLPQGSRPEPRHDAARKGGRRRGDDADGRQHHRRQPRARPAHRLRHPFQAERWPACCNSRSSRPGRINYFTHEGFRLPQLDEHVDMGGGAMSISRYFTEMLDPSMTWDDVAEMVRHWDGQFCLKGIMSVEDAKRAVEIGCTGIVLSNHGGRQLDGSRAAFDQLAEIVDAVGDRIDVMMDGGIQRGTHVLKALSLGAKAVGVGRYYLFPLAAAGQPGVERALGTDAGRDRARHEADGLHFGQPALACQSASSGPGNAPLNSTPPSRRASDRACRSLRSRCASARGSSRGSPRRSGASGGCAAAGIRRCGAWW